MNARPLPPGRVRASPQPGNQDERSCRSPYGCLAPGDGCPFHCPITDAEAAEMNAAAAAGETGAGEEADGQREGDVYCSVCGHVDFAHADWRGCARTDCNCKRVNMGYGWSEEPAPSAGQDTGQMRDEIAQTLHDAEPRGWRYLADLLLDGPLRQLIAERDDLRRELDQAHERLAAVDRQLKQHRIGADNLAAQVQRVRELAERWSTNADASNDATTKLVVFVTANELRRALDDPT